MSKRKLKKAQTGSLGKFIPKPKIKTPKINIGLLKGRKYDFTNKKFLDFDLSSNLFTKLASERTHPVRYKYPYSNMLEEYTWLDNASQISNHVVVPFNPVFNSNNELTSFGMENLSKDFINLSEFKNKYINLIKSNVTTNNKFTILKDELKLNLTTEVNKLHDNGLFHLDIHDGNIMVKSSADGLKILDFKILDPSGFPDLSKLTLQDFTNAPFTRGNQFGVNTPKITLEEIRNNIRFGTNQEITSPGIKDIKSIKGLKYGGSLPKAQIFNSEVTEELDEPISIKPFPETEIEAIGPDTRATMTENEKKLIEIFQNYQIDSLGQNVNTGSSSLGYTTSEISYPFKSKEHEIEYNKKLNDGTLNINDADKYFNLSDQQYSENEYIMDELDLLKMYREAGSPEINHFMNEEIIKGFPGRAHYNHGDTLTTKQKMDNLMNLKADNPNANFPTVEWDQYLNRPRHTINISNPVTSPFNKYIAPDKEEILNQSIEELSHAYQYSSEDVPYALKNFRSTSVDIDGNTIPLTDSSSGMCYDDDGNPEQCGKYAFPIHNENAAHSIIAPKLADMFGLHVGSSTRDADEIGLQDYYITDNDGTIRPGKIVYIPGLDENNRYFKEEELPEGYTMDMFDFSNDIFSDEDTPRWWPAQLKPQYEEELIQKLKEEHQKKYPNIDQETGDEMKYGGPLPKAQIVNSEITDQQQEIINANIPVDEWSKKYHKSDNFKSLATGWDIPENVIDKRIEDVINFNPNTDITFNTDANSAGMAYNNAYTNPDGSSIFSPTGGTMFTEDGKDMVNYNPEKGPPFHPMYLEWENLAAHEVAGHIGMLDEDSLGKDMKKILRKLGKQSVNMFLPSRKELGMSRKNYKEMKNHMKDNLEMRANLMHLRYKLEKEGVYMSTEGTAEGGDGTNPFTDEHLMEMYEQTDEGWKIKDEWKRNELFQFMAPQDIKWMMNNVADASTGDIPMVKYGGTLPKAKNGSILKCPPFCFGKSKTPKIEIPKISLTGAYKASYGIKPISLKLNKMLTSSDYQSSLNFIYHNMTTPKVLSETLQGKKTSGVWDVYGLNVNDVKFKELGIEILKHNDSGINNYNTTIKSLINDAVSQTGTGGSYFKSDLLRNSGVGTNIFDEFKTLQDMHSIQPHRVIQPLDLSFSNTGNILGYNMERFPGVSLRDYTSYGLNIPKYTLLNIDRSIKKLHSKGLVHGDLHTGNIMINPTTGRDFRFIDPVGYPNIFENPSILDKYMNKQGIFGINEGQFQNIINEPLGLQRYLIDQDYHHLNKSLFIPNKYSLPYMMHNKLDLPHKGRKINLQKYGGQTPWLSLDTRPDKTYEEGGEPTEEPSAAELQRRRLELINMPLNESNINLNLNRGNQTSDLTNSALIGLGTGLLSTGIRTIPYALKNRGIRNQAWENFQDFQNSKFGEGAFGSMSNWESWTDYCENNTCPSFENFTPNRADFKSGEYGNVDSWYQQAGLPEDWQRQKHYTDSFRSGLYDGVKGGVSSFLWNKLMDTRWGNRLQNNLGFNLDLRLFDKGGDTSVDPSAEEMQRRQLELNRIMTTPSSEKTNLNLSNWRNVDNPDLWNALTIGAGTLLGSAGLRNFSTNRKQNNAITDSYNMYMDQQGGAEAFLENFDNLYCVDGTCPLVQNNLANMVGDHDRPDIEWWMDPNTGQGPINNWTDYYKNTHNVLSDEEIRSQKRSNLLKGGRDALISGGGSYILNKLMDTKIGNKIQDKIGMNINLGIFNPKKEGGENYAKRSGRSYQNGGGILSYDAEMEKLLNFIQQEEAGWDYVKNKPSAVLKEDGKTYYKQFEGDKFYPYYVENSDGSLEENATVGFGTHGADVYETYKEGMDLNVANSNMQGDVEKSLRSTKIHIDGIYGDGAYDKLSDNEKFMLADFTYNLGSLNDFPLFTDAIVTRDADAALLEYIRKDEPGGSPLARNESYLNTYLQPWVDLQIENKRKEAEQLKIKESLNIFNSIPQYGDPGYINPFPIDNTGVGTNNPFGGWKEGGQIGSQLPKAQNGNLPTGDLPTGGSINQVFADGDFINGWNKNNIAKWRSKRGHTFTELMEFVMFTQTNEDGVPYSGLYSNRSEVPFTWDNTTGLPNQNIVNKKAIEQEFPHGLFSDDLKPDWKNYGAKIDQRALIEDPSNPGQWIDNPNYGNMIEPYYDWNTGQFVTGVGDLNMEKYFDDLNFYSKYNTEYNNFSVNMDETFKDKFWYKAAMGTTKADRINMHSLARDANWNNFAWQGGFYSVEQEEDNIFKWRTDDELNKLFKNQLNFMKGNVEGNSLLNEMIENKDITEAEDLYDYLLEYYTKLEDKDQQRILKDIKKDNPKGYLFDLALTDQIDMINSLREIQTEAKQTIEYDNKERNKILAGLKKSLPFELPSMNEIYEMYYNEDCNDGVGCWQTNDGSGGGYNANSPISTAEATEKATTKYGTTDLPALYAAYYHGLAKETMDLFNISWNQQAVWFKSHYTVDGDVFDPRFINKNKKVVLNLPEGYTKENVFDKLIEEEELWYPSSDPYYGMTEASEQYKKDIQGIKDNKTFSFITDEKYWNVKDGYTNFSKMYESARQSEFKENFAKGFGFKDEEIDGVNYYEMFMNANEPNTDDPFINEAIEGWINQANILDINTDFDVSSIDSPKIDMGPFSIIPWVDDYYQGDKKQFNFKDLTGGDDKMPYWLQNQVQGIYNEHNKNSYLKKDWRYDLNRKMTDYEIWKSDLQNYVDNSSNFIDDFGLGVYNWFEGMPRSFSETIESPTYGNVINSGLDIISVLGPKGINSLWKLPGATKSTIRNRFRDVTLQNSLKTNYNIFKSNIKDDIFLQYMKNLRKQGFKGTEGANRRIGELGITNPWNVQSQFKPNKKFTDGLYGAGKWEKNFLGKLVWTPNNNMMLHDPTKYNVFNFFNPISQKGYLKPLPIIGAYTGNDLLNNSIIYPWQEPDYLFPGMLDTKLEEDPIIYGPINQPINNSPE